MKISMVIDNLMRGGRERRLVELLKGLLKTEDIHIELVILSRKIEYKEVFDLGLPIHILERKPKKDPRVFFRLFQICKRFAPNIIHSWGLMSSIYAIPTAKLLRAKFINANIYDAPQGLGISDSRFFRAQLTFPFSDVVLANSAAGLKAYQAPKNRSLFIHNGIAIDRAYHLEDEKNLRDRYQIETERVVGMIGAFHPRKDYDTFIKAALLVLQQYPETTFLAIGDGPMLKHCKSLVTDKFSRRILFLGQINDVESVINLFDVGVLSTNSAVHGEGISNAIMEYMMLAKPVVATEGGGTSEIVHHDETGYLVSPAAPELLASKISELLKHPEVAKRMGEKGRRRIEQDFSLSEMVNKYLDLYVDLS